MVSLCSCEAYMTSLCFLALLLVILVESLAAAHITTWIMVLCALTRLSQVIREGNTHMYQSSCFMGQWFPFIRQLLQIFLKLCPVLFCFAVRCRHLDCCRGNGQRQGDPSVSIPFLSLMPKESKSVGSSWVLKCHDK